MRKIVIEDAGSSRWVSVGYYVVVVDGTKGHGTALPEMNKEDMIRLADKIYDYLGVDKESAAFLRGVEEGRSSI